MERNIKNMKISNKYDRLVRKLIAGESSSEEMEELAHWNVVETKMKKQFDAAKNIVENGAIERRIWDKIDSRCQAPVERSQKLQLRYWRVALAACITALLIIGGGIFFFDKGHTASQRIIEYTEVVSSNSRLYVLPDSSKVWMQAGSRLRFSQDFMSNREVWLEGVSTFEVTKREGHNFKVYIDQAFVEVKGTVFRVQSTCQDGAEVTLFSGKVDFNVKASQRKVEMKPLQQIVFHPEKDEVILKNIGNISWDEGRYKFVDMRMDDLIEAIHDIYHIPVELDRKVARNDLFTGYMRYDDPASKVIEKICINMNLKFKKETQKIIIYK